MSAGCAMRGSRPCDVASFRDGVLGVGAVHGVAGVDLVLAQGLPAVDAVGANAAARPEPRNADPVTDLRGADIGPDLFDDPDAFMPGDELT
jgi:hypothetical protein